MINDFPGEVPDTLSGSQNFLWTLRRALSSFGSTAAWKRDIAHLASVSLSNYQCECCCFFFFCSLNVNSSLIIEHTRVHSLKTSWQTECEGWFPFQWHPQYEGPLTVKNLNVTIAWVYVCHPCLRWKQVSSSLWGKEAVNCRHEGRMIPLPPFHHTSFSALWTRLSRNGKNKMDVVKLLLTKNWLFDLATILTEFITNDK